MRVLFGEVDWALSSLPAVEYIRRRANNNGREEPRFLGIITRSFR
jgi:hypothetical protein